MPDLTFTGIGSGLEVSTIVEAIVAAEKDPYTDRVTTKQSELTTDISAVGSLKSALESLSSSISGLSNSDSYQQRTTSGEDSFVTLSASDDAEVGSYSVKVDVLAQAHKVVSGAIDSDEAIGEGTLTLSVNNESFDIVTSDSDTLSDIRDAINNSDDNDSITATIITDDNGQHLVLTSQETGVENSITATVTDIDGNNSDTSGLSRLAYDVSDADPLNHITNLSEVTEALDAQITIDGTLVVTNSSNTFEDVIDGVDITATMVHDTDDDVSQISFAEDNSNVAKSLATFVSSYNELKELADNLGTSTEDEYGVLAGDSLLREVMSKLRSEFFEKFDTGDGESTSLVNLGIESDQYGILSLDTEVLNDYIASDPDAVEQFFVGTDNDGFAGSMEELINYYTDDTDGIIQGRIDSKNNQIDDLDDTYASFELRMEQLEARLYSQYNAMDLIVANLNSTSSYVMAQLENMPGVVSSS